MSAALKYTWNTDVYVPFLGGQCLIHICTVFKEHASVMQIKSCLLFPKQDKHSWAFALA